MSVDETPAAAESPRQVRRGDKLDKKPAQLFSELERRAFEQVTSYVTEINDKIESGSVTQISSSRLTPLDYKIAFDTLVKNADLNRGMTKNLTRHLSGTPIGVGSMNMLIATLGKMLISKEYSLFPRGRFFVNAVAFRDEKNRLRLPKMPQRATEVLASIPTTYAGQRYFDSDGRPMTPAGHRAAFDAVIAEKQRGAEQQAEADKLAAEKEAMLAEEFYFPDNAFARQDAALSLDELTT